MPLITTEYGMKTTADEVVAGVDLTGIRAVVTGASSGIGVETARSLARAGAEVTLAVRDTTAGQRVADDITATTGSSRVRAAHLDLADRASVAAFVDAWDGPLHLLINNAGIMAGPLERTPEGWELQFATNHLGHFALALGLHGALAAGAASDDRLGGARIVSVSSSGHLGSPVVFDDVQFDRRPYDQWAAYGQSKTANVLFAVEATCRWAGDGIVANALMPGGIATNLQKHIPQSVKDGYARMAEAGEIFMKSTQQGAATTLIAAIAPEFARTGGHYLEDGNEVPVVANDAEVPPIGGGVRQWAVDPEAATRLWTTSVALLGQPPAPSAPDLRTVRKVPMAGPNSRVDEQRLPSAAPKRHNAGMDDAVRDYIDAIAPERRPLFDRIHRLIFEAQPDAAVVLSYQMPTYEVGRYRLYVGVWKHGLSFYGWEQGRDAGFAARHPDLVTSKGTIKLRPDDAARIPDDEFRDLLRAALEG